MKTLSDKRTWTLVKQKDSKLSKTEYCYPEKDVKQFIKEEDELIFNFIWKLIEDLSEEFNFEFKDISKMEIANCLRRKRNKLAGEELVESEEE